MECEGIRQRDWERERRTREWEVGSTRRTDQVINGPNR